MMDPVSSHIALFSDDYFMREALSEARRAFASGEIPVGAVVVSQNRIIARAHNQTERLRDVTAHAEILAITAAANYLDSKYLSECTLYVTLEPCVMCAGALHWAQLGRVVVGATDPKRGFMRHGRQLLHPKTIYTEGLLAQECQELILRFFRQLRT
jgi:tRNA(adenine34) deaminase